MRILNIDSKLIDLDIHTHQEDHSMTKEETNSAITESSATGAAADDNVATIPVIVVHDEDKDVAVLEHDQDVADVATTPITSNGNEEPPPYAEKDSYIMADEPDNYYDASQLLLDEDPVREDDEEEGDQDYDLLADIQQSSEQQLQQQQVENEDEEDEEDDLLTAVSLSPLEKLIKFSNSTLVLQRLVVTREISTLIHEISVQDAVDTVLPIIVKLAKDTEDSVKEALAGELDKIMYYYYENAPPVIDSVAYPDAIQSHIPRNAFAYTIIEFLLDQNTTLASIAQQSVVTLAAELADTAQGSEKYALHQALLDVEIFQGVVLGLISIFSGKQQQQQKDSDDSDGEEQGTNSTFTTEKVSKAGDSENMDITVLDALASHENTNTTTAVVEKKLPSTTVDDPINTIISSATSTLIKNYDNGGVNLAKMVCLMLMSALAPVFGPEGCTEKILPIVESMVADPMFYVRKEAAAAVGSLSTTVPLEVTLERLLPLYLKLSVDTIWHVRRSCVFALPLLCEVLPKDMKATIAVEGIELFKNDVSRNVRNSLADITGEVISKFLPEDWKETGNPGEVPEELLDFFLSLGNTTTTNANQMYKMDTERIHNCAYNFPAVVLTAGVGYWDSHLKDTYLNLTKDYQLKVRRTFAYSLHDIARIIGAERTERDLVQIFALYLMDLDDVKQGVLEHLSEFLNVLAVSSRNEYIPILAEVWDGVMNNWHLRDILANQLRDISRLFDASRVVEHILPLAIRACHDEFASVRETGVEIFPVILDIVKRTVDEDGENLSQVAAEGADDTETLFERQQKYALALLNHVMEKLDDLVRSATYRTRLVFTQICRSLLDAGINPADFASFFLPRLALLVKDPVVNVRIAASKTMHTLCSINGYSQDIENIVYADEIAMEDESSPKQILDDIIYRLATDKDRDVRFYVSDFISEEELEQYQKKMAVEELKIADDTSRELTSKALPPPPTPPAHLIMLPPAAEYQGISTVQQVLADLDEHPEEENLQTHVDVISEEVHSVNSPMEIVHDDFDATISLEKGKEPDEGKENDVDEIMTDAMDISEEDQHQLEEHFEDDEEEEEDDHATEMKARHIYLSKTPAHALSDTDMVFPTASATTNTALSNTSPNTTSTTASSD
ncbi:protein phosphatase 4 regulatory subunit 1 [Mucor ambiguus]|uniref:Protein phosphatase 4 regulatory subunit 1 n=1 Tax=Mucor ambiguus TaxID=91626 RepID=A0A0C9LXL4_9FUNG|nr:protein phosphatase 4 regulatory subunit 1 [Mucor ambiguus]